MLNGSDVVVEESLEEQGSKPLCETLRDFDSVIESLESTKDGKKFRNVFFQLIILTNQVFLDVSFYRQHFLGSKIIKFLLKFTKKKSKLNAHIFFYHFI